MTNNETLIQLFIELAGIPGKSLKRGRPRRAYPPAA